MDGCIQYPDGTVESTKLAWGAEQVRYHLERGRALLISHSASPLNGEAAELWDKDPEEFKRKVVGRHREVDDE